MQNLADLAKDYFLNHGYSCSESVVMAAADLGYAKRELVNCATGFSGGVGSGCLCGTISGAILVIGYNFGKNKTNTARALSKQFHEEFKKEFGATCCRSLTVKFKDEFHTNKRKEHCAKMIDCAMKILEGILDGTRAAQKA